MKIEVILTSRRDKYRISVILSRIGNGYKLPLLLILMGEPWENYRKRIKNITFCTLKKVFIYFQCDGWCTSNIFKDWIKEIFLPYENEHGDKCILIYLNNE